MSMLNNMFETPPPAPVDLTESFYWICSRDIHFSSENGLETSFVRLKNKTGDKFCDMLLIKQGSFYKIGQYRESCHAFGNTSDSDETLRHPLSFVQQYKLPTNMPMNQFLLGPVKAINMTRILRLVQADLSNDKEMMNDIVSNLHLSYGAGGFPYLSNHFA